MTFKNNTSILVWQKKTTTKQMIFNSSKTKGNENNTEKFKNSLFGNRFVRVEKLLFTIDVNYIITTYN